jgi:hypothetical protein
MKHNGERPIGVCLRKHNREVSHAYNSFIVGFDRSRLPAMAGEQLHPNGGFNQKDPECCRGYCRCFVASERFWSSQLPIQAPRVTEADPDVDHGAANCSPGRAGWRTAII